VPARVTTPGQAEYGPSRACLVRAGQDWRALWSPVGSGPCAAPRVRVMSRRIWALSLANGRNAGSYWPGEGWREPMYSKKPDRRGFLKNGAALAGLVVGTARPASGQTAVPQAHSKDIKELIAYGERS